MTGLMGFFFFGLGLGVVAVVVVVGYLVGVWEESGRAVVPAEVGKGIKSTVVV